MAEFCLDCYNKRHGTHYTPREVSLDMDRCEDCKEQTLVIVSIGRRGMVGWWTRLSSSIEYWTRTQKNESLHPAKPTNSPRKKVSLMSIL